MENQDNIDVFCLTFKDGNKEGYILCPDKERLENDKLQIPKRFPGAIVSDTTYFVWANPDTYRQIWGNGGRLVVLDQIPPKCGEVC